MVRELTRTLNPLFKLAVMAGARAAVGLHLRRGESADARDERGRSALMLAASKGHCEVCRLLLEEGGADPELVDDEGLTALDLALKHGDPELVTLLRQYRVSGVEVPAAEATADQQPAYIALEPPKNMESQAEHTDAELSSESYDLSVWMEEIEPAPPPIDRSFLIDAEEIQTRLAKHAPEDSSEDWDDVEISLPAVGGRRRVPQGDGPRLIEQVQQLILGGLRDGWVFQHQVRAALCSPTAAREKNEEPEPQQVSNLEIVLGDLGILVEEGPAIPTPSRAPSDGDDEWDEWRMEQGVESFEALESTDADVEALYFREVGTRKVVNRETENRLGMLIAEGVQEALEAVGRSSVGRTEVLGTMKRVVGGELSLREVAEGIGTAAPTGTEERDTTRSVRESQALESWLERFGVLTTEPKRDRLEGLQVSMDSRVAAELNQLGLRPAFIESVASVMEREEGRRSAVLVRAGLRKAERARWKLIEANLRLVLWTAKRWWPLPYMDQVQEGNLGLIRAAERFDPSRGAKFSTYSLWWIKQSIWRAIQMTGETIRVPVHLLDLRRKLKRASQLSLTATGIEPSIQDLAASCEAPVQTVERALMQLDTVPIEEFDEDSQANPEYPDPLVDLEKAELHGMVRRVLESALSSKSLQVLTLRFGLDDGQERTLEEVGAMLGVTRERIRQIESKALKKLTHQTYARHLIGVLHGIDDAGELPPLPIGPPQSERAARSAEGAGLHDGDGAGGPHRQQHRSVRKQGRAGVHLGRPRKPRLDP